MIVVATENFEMYHEVVTELRDRGLAFTTIRPDEELPDGTEIVISGESDEHDVPAGVESVTTTAGTPRTTIEEAVAILRGSEGRTVVGIDPGEQPGVAVLVGDTVVAVFQVPPVEVAGIVRQETEDAPNPLVRIGDGARLIGARIVDDIGSVPVELVDETGTTPYLGSGTRGVADVLAAVNIARIEGERIDEREIEPTAGELQRIKDRSREQSRENRAIDGALARQVAVGELTIAEALDEHGRIEDSE